MVTLLLSYNSSLKSLNTFINEWSVFYRFKEIEPDSYVPGFSECIRENGEKLFQEDLLSLETYYKGRRMSAFKLPFARQRIRVLHAQPNAWSDMVAEVASGDSILKEQYKHPVMVSFYSFGVTGPVTFVVTASSPTTVGSSSLARFYMAHEFGHAGHFFAKCKLKWITDAVHLSVFMLVAFTTLKISACWSIVVIGVLAQCYSLRFRSGVFIKCVSEIYADWFALNVCDKATARKVRSRLRKRPSAFVDKSLSEYGNSFRKANLLGLAVLRYRTGRMFRSALFFQRTIDSLPLQHATGLFGPFAIAFCWILRCFWCASVIGLGIVSTDFTRWCVIGSVVCYNVVALVVVGIVADRATATLLQPSVRWLGPLPMCHVQPTEPL
ncbi:hypothetical protein GC163_17265 [bacterium]|nr:hypothetical protein [bacterium]